MLWTAIGTLIFSSFAILMISERNSIEERWSRNLFLFGFGALCALVIYTLATISLI